MLGLLRNYWPNYSLDSLRGQRLQGSGSDNKNCPPKHPTFKSTLQGINISHLGKRKIIFKIPFWGDMLVPWRVYLLISFDIFWKVLNMSTADFFSLIYLKLDVDTKLICNNNPVNRLNIFPKSPGVPTSLLVSRSYQHCKGHRNV